MYNQNYLSNAGTGASMGATIGSVVPGVGTAIGAGVGALGGLVLAGVQNRQAKKQMAEDERNRPKYQIPPEVMASLTMAEQQALEGMPAAQKQQYITDLQRSAGYSLSQQQLRKGGLVGIPQIQAQMDKGYFDLMAADYAARMQRQQNVYGQMQNLANYKDQAYQINKLNPYYEGIARRNANQGALYQNISNAGQLGMYALSNIGGMRQGAASPQVVYNNMVPQTPLVVPQPQQQQSSLPDFQVGNFYNQSPYIPYQR